jgi:hypothetical protein
MRLCTLFVSFIHTDTVVSGAKFDFRRHFCTQSNSSQNGAFDNSGRTGDVSVSGGNKHLFLGKAYQSSVLWALMCPVASAYSLTLLYKYGFSPKPPDKKMFYKVVKTIVEMD